MKISFEAIAEILSVQNDKKPLIGCILGSQIMDDVIASIISCDGRAIEINEIDKVKEKPNLVKSLLLTENILAKNFIKETTLNLLNENCLPITLYLNNETEVFKSRKIILNYIKECNISIIIGKENNINRLINYSGDSDEIKTIVDVDKNSQFIKAVEKFARKNNVIIVMLGKTHYLTNGYSEFFISNTNLYEEINFEIGPILAGMLSTSVSLFKSETYKMKYIIQTIIFFYKCISSIQKRNSLPISNQKLLKDLLFNEIESNRQRRYEIDTPIIYRFIR